MRAPDAFREQTDPSRWITFATNGKIIVRTGKVEIGQGILTALCQVVADELCVGPDLIEMAAASTALGPDEGYTVGSLSIEQSVPTMRFLGALMRERLLAQVSGSPTCSPEVLSVVHGVVCVRGAPTDTSYWTAGGALTVEAIDPERLVGLLSPQAYTVVGRSLARIDLPAKIRGGAFIQDLALPGMRHGRVLRPPHAGALLDSLDVGPLEQRYPQTNWIRIESFAACVSPTEGEAMQCVAAMARLATWRGEPSAGSIGGDVAKWLRQQPVTETVLAPSVPGDAPSAGQSFISCWSRPFIAHASIGLSTALAWFHDDKVEVWTHSQGIFFLREQLARVLELPLDSVAVHHVAGAGCYGHNGADDAALDAALMAIACPGVPVRVQWSRAEELSNAPFGAAGVAELGVHVDADGTILSWNTHVLGTSHGGRPGMHGQANLLSAAALGPAWRDPLIADTPEDNGGGASRNARPIYDVGHHSLKLSLVKPPFRSSALRALGAYLNIIAIEGMMEDIAQDRGLNSLDFRRRSLSDSRALGVMDRVCEMSGWDGNAETPDGRYLGFGLGRYKGRGAYCAVVVEIELSASVDVRRVWCAVDAGTLINPDGAINQIEGGIVQSMSWTLHEAVTFDGTVPAVPGWAEYPILRFGEVPEIEVALVRNDEASKGVGETAQGPTAAAICNAVSSAIGMRVRDMPISRDRLMQLLSA